MLAELKGGVIEMNEVYRFPNQPVSYRGEMHWDILRLWHEMKKGLESLTVNKLTSIGVDTWGVDYALLGEGGRLLENPYCYRDSRTEGVMEKVFAKVPREKIYSITGIQFMPFNTLYQLYAANQATPKLLQNAETLLTVPDLLNYWLTGERACDFTNATTTQFVDAKTRQWAKGLLTELGLPTHLLAPIVEPGTVMGKLQSDVSATLAGTPVVAPACHDTGAAFAAVTNTGKSAFLSSGTWSLLGAELPAPIVTPRALELNFTNEGGVCGTTRVLKNIMGLWLLQSCRRAWTAEGHEYSYQELMEAAAAAEKDAFRTLFNPDDASFLNPPNMLTAIADYAKKTGQPVPSTPPQYTRAILESLAFRYRQIVDWLEEISGVRFEDVHIMGGGSKNKLLDQFTADASGRAVVAGPAEATALGNIAMQMLATGTVSTLAEARQVIERSFPTERFEPADAARWNAEYKRFQQYK